MASFVPPNAPVFLDLQSFQTTIDNFGGLAKACRFVIQITGTGITSSSNLNFPPGTSTLANLGYIGLMGDLSYLCESATFPGRQFDFMDYRYYGPSFQLPFNSKYDQQTDFVFLCRTQSYERQLFDDWMETIAPSQSFDFNYPSTYYGNITVFQMSDYAAASTQQVAPVYAWQLINAWPVAISEQKVSWADQDLLRLTVTFSYHYWTRPNRDQPPAQGTIVFTSTGTGAQ